MILLEGKKIADIILNNLKIFFSNKFFSNKYIGVFLLSDDKASSTYVNMKKEFGKSIGLELKIFGENHINSINGTNLDNLDNILYGLEYLNNDENCVGILFQLPLPERYKIYKSDILSKIKPTKDIDGLGGILFGLSTIDYIDFVPATPYAVLNILKFYNLDIYKGKKISVIGQSNLIGKPLAVELIKLGGEIFSFNQFVNKSILKEVCKSSDIIISATGDLKFLDNNYVRPDKTQIIIDVGRGVKNGKTSGDVNFDLVKDLVYAITPVPGGIGPLTVACLFDNIRVIYEQKYKLNNLFL